MTILLPLVLAAVTATFHPARPTVGDPIAIEFPEKVTLERSPDFEIVSQQGKRVVIRTFEPRPFAIHGVTGSIAFRNMIVPVHSVLQPNDPLKPAPLRPPQPEPYPRRPFVLIGIAAALAALAWTAVALLARRVARAAYVAPPLPPAERFRQEVAALRAQPVALRWARLADAARNFLADTDPMLGHEWTTDELLPRVANGEVRAVLRDVLRQGDLEKFSPWGAAPLDFDAVAARALLLAPEPVVTEEAAA